MKKERFQRFYSVMQQYAGFCLRMYYRKLQIVNYDEHVPTDGAVFIAANHQNTFLDPVIIAARSKIQHQHNFITRADVFNPVTNVLFKQFKMVPIYRQRDSGSAAMRKNEEMFKVYTDRLLEEESFIIFVEGDHGRERRLRPLKKGIARIALQTLQEADFELPMQIVPAGLHYHDHDSFYSDALLVYGPPMDLAPYHEDLKERPAKAINAIKENLTQEMRKVMIDIQSEDYYPTIEHIREWMAPDLALEAGKDPQDLYQLFQEEQQLVKRLDELANQDKAAMERLSDEVKGYRMKLRLHKIMDFSVAEGARTSLQMLTESLQLLLGFPIFLYGLLNHGILVLLARSLPANMVKDPVFHPAMRYAMGVVLTPVLYLIQAGLVSAFAGWVWGLIYLISLLPAGRFAAYWWRWRKRWQSRRRMAKITRDGDQVLRNARNLLWKSVQKIMKQTAQKEPTSVK